MSKMLSARVDAELHRRVLVHCAMNDKKVQDFVREAVEAKLESGNREDGETGNAERMD